jgi:hypothetical protein
VFTEECLVADDRQPCATSPLAAPARRGSRIETCGAGDPRRGRAEAFIRGRFQRSHGATIATFMPTLVLLADDEGEIAAAAGFRCAAQEPLFLERYLPAPIEQRIASQVTTPVRRADILEIGNFAARDARHAKLLMSFMPRYFLDLGARWIVFTATSAIRGLLSSMGGDCIEVGAADGARVAGGADEWGRYYSTDPRVMAGFLPSARRVPALWKTA